MRSKGRRRIPETHLTVARGVGVPVGKRLQGLHEPRPLVDEGGQSNVGHFEPGDVSVSGMVGENPTGGAG